jgi:hypothetical protein
MFGSTAILPPRTKRWAEAKVLADCINLKVRRSPFFLYLSPLTVKPTTDLQALSVQ